MKVTNILLVEQHLMPDYADPATLRPTNTRTHQQKGHCLPNEDITKLMDILKKEAFPCPFQ